ncbi:MAG: hypothetical protein SOZ59_15770 [Candidatus Limivivens sp.]|nr:hypothetical protein [Candidatus Limivivens sp.]
MDEGEQRQNYSGKADSPVTILQGGVPDISLACKAKEGGDAVASLTDGNAADNEIDGTLYHDYKWSVHQYIGSYP